MKILLVSPWERRHRRFRSGLRFLMSYPSLALPVLAALVPPELEAEISVFDEFAQSRLPAERFDVVGITVPVSEAGRAFELADHFRARGAFVVLGGYFPTLCHEAALEHADAIVTGAGGQAWPRLLRDVASGSVTERVYADGPGAPCPDVIPARSLTTSPPYAPVTPVLTAMGCPHRCTFCAITRLTPYSRRPVASVIAELTALKRRHVVFCDANFFADRRYVLELLAAMEPLRLRWGATATVSVGFDEELLAAARRAGCIGVLIGFESLAPTTLEHVNKRFAEPGTYRQAIDNVHRHGMTINGTFMMGLDTDTEADLARLPERVRELGIDVPLFFVLTPVPGGPLFDALEAEGRLLTRDWHRYTQAEVVYQPKAMTPQRLEELYRDAWRRTYTTRAILRRALSAPGASPAQRLAVVAMNLGFAFLGRDR